jgi:hypothetical protein
MLSSLLSALFTSKADDGEIVGCFDSFAQGRFVSGWARVADGKDRRVRVIVVLGDTIVAEGDNDRDRDDGLPGFRIDTGGRISARDIVERNCRVFGVNASGRRFGLPRHGPLIAELIRQCFPQREEDAWPSLPR